MPCGHGPVIGLGEGEKEGGEREREESRKCNKL